MQANQDRLRQLPSVEQLLQEPTVRALEAKYGRVLTLEAARAAIDAARQNIRAGKGAPMPALLMDDVRQRVEALDRPTLRPVVNATGVIIHTNLGRAPLSDDALKAMAWVGAGYSNLEYDVQAGERGSRYVHAAELLRRLTGAEDALLVNNNAAALLLVLTTLARGREVILSRGQLVEIGGGFRIPEIMQESGARLVEVGTTNRTYIEDYARAVTDKTALLLRVHHSNFALVGFIYEPSLSDLVALGQERGLLVVNDLGSGTLLDTAPFGLAHEPTVQESLAAGAHLVTFSGDKLLGGPQAGLIVGSKALIARLKQQPMTRALRVDKVTLAGMQATLRHYLRGEATKKIPVWRMIAMPLAEVANRAEAWRARLAERGLEVRVMDGQSAVGGGSLPGETLPTKLIAITSESPDDLARRLRLGEPAVIARIQADTVVLDPRTVLPEQDEALLSAVQNAWCAA